MNLMILKRLQEKSPDRFKEVDTPELFKATNLKNWPMVTAFCEGGGYAEPHSFQCSPEVYIKFAKEDLSNSNLKGLVNSISNSKRAIHCSVDLVFETFNLSVNKGDEQKYPDIRGFNLKLEILKDMGFVAPRILSKYNKIRNEVEHGYIKPSKKEAEEALDIAEIFCEMLKIRLENIIDSFMLSQLEEEIAHDSLGGCITFEFDSDVRQWIVSYSQKEGPTVFTVISIGEISRIATQLCINNSHNNEKTEEGIKKLLVAIK